MKSELKQRVPIYLNNFCMAGIPKGYTAEHSQWRHPQSQIDSLNGDSRAMDSMIWVGRVLSDISPSLPLNFWVIWWGGQLHSTPKGRAVWWRTFPGLSWERVLTRKGELILPIRTYGTLAVNASVAQDTDGMLTLMRKITSARESIGAIWLD